eukprot:1723666-Pyramimonas_sp.AAC.1
MSRVSLETALERSWGLFGHAWSQIEASCAIMLEAILGSPRRFQSHVWPPGNLKPPATPLPPLSRSMGG